MPARLSVFSKNDRIMKEKEEYTVFPSHSVPVGHACYLASKTAREEEAVIISGGVELAKVKLSPADLREFGRRINKAITEDLLCATGRCEVEFEGLTAVVEFYAEYESRIGGSHEDGSMERYAVCTGDRVDVRVVYDDYGREYADYAIILEKSLN